MRLLPVEPDEIARVWPRVEPWLKTMCAKPECDQTPETLRALCAASQGQMTVIQDDAGRSVAVGVTQVREYQSGIRSCWVLALAGTQAAPWPAVIHEIEEGARKLGCHRVEFVGRRGWSRILPSYRAEPGKAGTHFTRDLQ